MSPIRALPDGYKLGQDNRSWLMRQKKKLQFLLAAGPRVPKGFWKWRDIPFQFILIHGPGDLRFENTDGTHDTFEWLGSYYLSRIQPWCRFHISLQWPLFFNCHLIYRKRDVVVYPRYQSAFGICKMLTFGIGFKRDADKVYWLTANWGGNFE